MSQCRTASEWTKYEREKKLEELQNKGLESNDYDRLQQEYEQQFTIAGKSKRELIQKYKQMGINVPETEIIQLKNERTGQKEFRKVKKQ